MTDSDNKEDKEFNQTLKRMLETPPKPHVEKGKDSSRSQSLPVSDQDFQNGSDTKKA